MTTALHSPGGGDRNYGGLWRKPRRREREEFHFSSSAKYRGKVIDRGWAGVGGPGEV